MTTWEDIRHFTADEFWCRCGQCTANAKMDMDFIAALDDLRDVCGFPFVITSGYRCLQHPREIAKALPGAHTLGVAADIACYGSRAFTLLECVLEKDAGRGGFGIGIAQKGDIETRFIHLDMRADGKAPRPWIWSY